MSSFLPFLYQTRTILRPTPRTAVAVARTFHTTQRHFKAKGHDDIPFITTDIGDESFPEERSFLEEEETRTTRPTPTDPHGTITPIERQIFERIFADIKARGLKPRMPAGGPPPEPTESSRSAMLIMQQAALDAGQSRRSPVTSPAILAGAARDRNKALLRFPAELRAAASKALDTIKTSAMGGGSRRWDDVPNDDGSVEGEDNFVREEWKAPAHTMGRTIELEEKRHPERTRVEGLIAAATTDLELWDVLEKEVFTMPARLDIGQKTHAAEAHEKQPKEASTKTADSPAEETATLNDVENAESLVEEEAPTVNDVEHPDLHAEEAAIVADIENAESLAGETATPYDVENAESLIEETATPAEETATPAEETTTPAEETTTPAEETATATDIEKADSPAEETVTTTDVETADFPAEEMATATDVETADLLVEEAPIPNDVENADSLVETATASDIEDADSPVEEAATATDVEDMDSPAGETPNDVEEVDTPVEETLTSDDAENANSPQKLSLYIYGPLYPAYLLLALRRLDVAFHRPSPLVFSILPRIKELGLESYVLGVSTPFYNELLDIYWRRRGDLVGMLDLLEEMRHCGLYFDKQTASTLNRAHRTLIDMNKGQTQSNFTMSIMTMPEYERSVRNRLDHWHRAVDMSIKQREEDMGY
ncbi:hypothetical protein F5B20DRAFT_506055 [Whalleya microplaca]|nr:hypothetical protein F5B20DRAFT_506055 [Whalleya microplaca]